MRFFRRRLDPRVAAVIAYNPEAVGRAQAWAFIRRVHAEHPNPDRQCFVPDCCDVSTPPGQLAAHVLTNQEAAA